MSGDTVFTGWVGGADGVGDLHGDEDASSEAMSGLMAAERCSERPNRRTGGLSRYQRGLLPAEQGGNQFQENRVDRLLGMSPP
jgi:hypothetical protein